MDVQDVGNFLARGVSGANDAAPQLALRGVAHPHPPAPAAKGKL